MPWKLPITSTLIFQRNRAKGLSEKICDSYLFSWDKELLTSNSWGVNMVKPRERLKQMLPYQGMKHLYGLQFAFWWSTIYFEAIVVNGHCSIPLLIDPSLCHFHQLHQALLSYRLQNKHLLDVNLFLPKNPPLTSHDGSGEKGMAGYHWDAIVTLRNNSISWERITGAKSYETSPATAFP